MGISHLEWNNMEKRIVISNGTKWNERSYSLFIRSLPSVEMTVDNFLFRRSLPSVEMTVDNQGVIQFGIDRDQLPDPAKKSKNRLKTGFHTVSL